MQLDGNAPLDMLSLIAQYLHQPVTDTGASPLTTPLAVQFCNDGYVQFAIDTGCFWRAIPLSVVSGTAVYPLPADTYDVVDVIDTQYGHKLRRTTLEMVRGASMENVGWASLDASSPYTLQYIFDPTIGITIVPTPTASVTLNVYATFVPSDVAGSIAPLLVAGTNAVPTLPSMFQNCPALWAAGNLAQTVVPDDDVAAKGAEGAIAYYHRRVSDYLNAKYQGVTC